jgi:hypothetical protein
MVLIVVLAGEGPRCRRVGLRSGTVTSGVAREVLRAHKSMTGSQLRTGPANTQQPAPETYAGPY